MSEVKDLEGDESLRKRLTHKCDVCEKQFTCQQNLKRHIKSHQPSQSYTCRVCSKTYARIDNLKRHEKLHISTPNQQKSVGEREDLAVPGPSHMNVLNGRLVPGGNLPINKGSVLSESSTILCQICKLTFKSKRNLNRHVKSTHLKLDIKTCTLCKKEFHRNDKYNDHVKICSKRKAQDSGARDSKKKKISNDINNQINNQPPNNNEDSCVTNPLMVHSIIPHSNNKNKPIVFLQDCQQEWREKIIEFIRVKKAAKCCFWIILYYYISIMDSKRVSDSDVGVASKRLRIPTPEGDLEINTTASYLNNFFELENQDVANWFSESETVNPTALVSPTVTPSDAPAACSDESATNSDAPACLVPCVVFPNASSANPDTPAYLNVISPCV
ncbi:hypothetical protein JTE90_005238, partial [Oedothorax gibbosus]